MGYEVASSPGTSPVANGAGSPRPDGRLVAHQKLDSQAPTHTPISLIMPHWGKAAGNVWRLFDAWDFSNYEITSTAAIIAGTLIISTMGMFETHELVLL